MLLLGPDHFGIGELCQHFFHVSVWEGCNLLDSIQSNILNPVGISVRQKVEIDLAATVHDSPDLFSRQQLVHVLLWVGLSHSVEFEF